MEGNADASVRRNTKFAYMQYLKMKKNLSNNG